MALINMSCGQTFLSPSSLKRMNQQVVEPIYYPNYYKTEIQTVDMLKTVYQTKNTTLLVTGTGTYGIEMGLRSTFEKGEKVAVIDGGTFGAVASSILAQRSTLRACEVCWRQIRRSGGSTPFMMRRRQV